MATKVKYDPKGEFEVIKKLKHPDGPHDRRKVQKSVPGARAPNPHGGQEVGYFLPGETCSFPHFVDEPTRVEFLVDVVGAVRPLPATPAAKGGK